MQKKTIRDLALAGKKVVVRVDFNVPLQDGRILNDTRIIKALPTIRFLREQGARVILMTHLGRPKGKVVPELSVRPLAVRLGNLLEDEVLFASDCGGPESQRVTAKMRVGQVVLLENLRFYPEEEQNDPAFAQLLASLGEVYVNDAFGTAHRSHASTEGITKYLPAVAGFLMEREIYVLSQVLEKPCHPFVVILGGAKVSDKIFVIENLLKRADSLLIGGAMANNFLKAQGHEVGTSRLETKQISFAGELLEKAKHMGVEIVLPRDVVVAAEFSAEAASEVVAVENIPADKMILDMGPQTLKAFRQIIRRANMIVWNGPLGVYEFPKFAVGTHKIVKAVASASGKAIIGGGDVVAAVEKTGLAAKIYHISTGGGASLSFLGGKSLPGVAVLGNKGERKG